MGRPLGTLLGIQGARSFLLQHELLSLGRCYRVLDSEKRYLFMVREELNKANLLAGLGVRAGRGDLALTWTVADASDNPVGTITFQYGWREGDEAKFVHTGYFVLSTLADSSGTPILGVYVERSGFGQLSATATLPGGRALFKAQGNLIRRNFSIQDPAGRELAKVHEAFASVRDTYTLDLVGDVDPLGPLIFAILIDREKEQK